MPAPQAVIFDVDGTLVDTNDLHAASWVEAFRHFGIDVTFEAARHQIGKGGDQLMPVFLDKATLKRRGEAIEAFRADRFKRDYLRRSVPFPGVRALFQRVKAAGQTIVIASSGKRHEIDHHLKVANIADLVDEIVTGDDAEQSKPEPDIFGVALKRIEGKTAIVVGDSPYDAEAAGKVGLETVGLLCGGFTADDLRDAGCETLYADPAALASAYDNSPLHRPTQRR